MTPISSPDSFRRQGGFTLIELLIALAIVASFTAIAVFSMAGRMAHLTVDRAAAILAADLSRGRILAREDQFVELIADQQGYAIRGVVERRLEPGVAIVWNDQSSIEQEIFGDIRERAIKVEFAKGDARARLKLAPVTGRISIEREAS